MRVWGRSLDSTALGQGAGSACARAGTVLVVFLACLMTAGVAGATTYTVSNATQLAADLTSAGSNPGPDTITMAAGTYTGPFTYNNTSANDGLTIQGAGVGETTIK